MGHSMMKFSPGFVFYAKKYYFYNKVVFSFLLVARWVGDARIRFISLFEGLDWPLVGAQ